AQVFVARRDRERHSWRSLSEIAAWNESKVVLFSAGTPLQHCLEAKAALHPHRIEVVQLLVDDVADVFEQRAVIRVHDSPPASSCARRSFRRLSRRSRSS